MKTMSDRKADTGDALEAKAEKPEYWKFTQWFRKMQNTGARQEEGEDHDHLTAVEFDDTGRFLATGDKSGNIVVLESDTARSKNHVHYSFFGEFTSHFPDFDFVRSMPIDEKINKMKFGPSTTDALHLITTNDKQIKLWKMKEKEQYKLVNWNIEPVAYATGYAAISPLDLHRSEPIVKNLKVPKKVVTERTKMPTLRKLFANDVHNYNIASLSVTADKEAFISGDNLRINLWDLNIGSHAYNVLDVKPDDMNELSEIISSADCHPTSSNLFLYSTSLGNIMTCDLRQKALVDEPCQVYSEQPENDKVAADQTHGDEEQEHQTFFNEMTQNVTAAKFSKGGKFIFSRDYMSVKIWDVAMDKAPVETIYVHEYLRAKMWDLYSNDLLWDPFGLGISSKGDIVTGSYSNYFHIFDLGKTTDTFIQASQQAMKTTDLNLSKKKKHHAVPTAESVGDNFSLKKKGPNGFKIGNMFRGGKKKRGEDSEIVAVEAKAAEDYPYSIPFESLEFSKKVLDCAWHPQKDAVAVAGQNNLYIYAKTRK